MGVGGAFELLYSYVKVSVWRAPLPSLLVTAATGSGSVGRTEDAEHEESD